MKNYTCTINGKGFFSEERLTTIAKAMINNQSPLEGNAIDKVKILKQTPKTLFLLCENSKCPLDIYMIFNDIIVRIGFEMLPDHRDDEGFCVWNPSKFLFRELSEKEIPPKILGLFSQECKKLAGTCQRTDCWGC